MMKRLFLMLSMLTVWGMVCAQEWTKSDSLRLDHLLHADGEIKLNPRALEELKGNVSAGNQSLSSYKPWLEFNSSMPQLKLPKDLEIKMQLDVPSYNPYSNGVTFTADLAYHLTKYFTRDYWDFRNKRNIKRTLLVLKNYNADSSDSLQIEK